MKRVAIIAAMAGELKPLVKGWQRVPARSRSAANVDLWRRRGNATEWVAACAGAGQQAATRAFAAIEKDGPIHRVFSIGWAGALSESLKRGRAYTVSGVIDMRTGEQFPASVSQNGLLLVTSPRVADAAEKQRLAAAYGAGLVDMEAAAVARLAAMRGIPFQAVKGVSDGFSDDLPDFNRFISPDGQFQTLRLLFFVLPRPWHWPALVRMGENSNKASQAIRDLLLENLDEPGAIEDRNGNSNFKP